MRLGRGVLLVATISLLSSSNAVPATTGKSKGLKLQGDSSDKRYLRVHKAISTTRDEEERTFDLKKDSQRFRQKDPEQNDAGRRVQARDVCEVAAARTQQWGGRVETECALRRQVPAASLRVLEPYSADSFRGGEEATYSFRRC